MASTFDKIPSEIVIPIDYRPDVTVEEELETCQKLLETRIAKCPKIDPMYKPQKKTPPKFTYRFFCVCPRYCPNYSCRHSGNVVIDRDVLTKEEHICYLAQPRPNLAARRKHPHYYPKKVILSNCTARIEELAQPKIGRVKGTIEDYRHLLSKKRFKSLKKYLEKNDDIKFTSIDTALNYIGEERRLEKVARIMERRNCKKIKRIILSKQRKQIKKIICVLFEEMKDFLLNDQFLIDERSTLCSVILEQIRNFTDKDFYTTSNLREYQHILANNLTVWINKFISNLNIHIAPIKSNLNEPTERETLLPVKDYISCSESYEDEEYSDDEYSDFVEESLADMDMEFEREPPTEDTLI